MALLVVLAGFVLRVRTDVFEETTRSTTSVRDDDRPAYGDGVLDDANLHRLESPEADDQLPAGCPGRN